jgi:lipid-binding SYLF domain-containing protein
MKTSMAKLITVLLAAVLLSACATGGNVSEKCASVQRMRADTLAKLHKIEPDSQRLIRQSLGYAVFSNVGINLLFVSAGGGFGILRDNRTGRDIYMNMALGGVGLGLGIKDFRGVFVFTSKRMLDQFVNHGWDASAQADAAAKSAKKGDAWAGAVDVGSGIKLYQITENGLALQATIQGTKYWKDAKLN